MKFYIFALFVLLCLGTAGISAAEFPLPPDMTLALSEETPASEVGKTEASVPEQTQPEAMENESGGAEAAHESMPTEEPASGGEETPGHIADPLYPWNNAMYQFNDKLYFWVMKPVAKGYSKAFPQDIRVAVSNFFYNLTTPIRFVNNLLQLKFKNAGGELLRLVYNSTAGVGGLADVAKTDLKVTRSDQDLGLTLGHYGVGNGFYIVWPFLGPSSLRDTVGLVGDGFLDPVYYVTPWYNSGGIAAYERVNEISLHIGDYEDLKESAIDPYVAIRNAYIQHRQSKIKK